MISRATGWEGLCDGTLDAAFVVAGHPNQAIGDLTGRCQARLIPIEGNRWTSCSSSTPHDRSRIGANLYPGQTSGVNAFAVTAELVALASLPESEVRTLRDVLNERLGQFTRLHPALTTLTWEGMQAGSIALLHPGMLDAVPTSRRTPSHGIRGRATSGALPTLSPASSAATPTDGTGPWKAPRHWRGPTPCRSSRPPRPSQPVRGGLNQPGPGTDRAAHTGQRNPGTRPSPDPA